MDSALDKYTGAIVEAEDLWLVDYVDKSRYICRGCGATVTPASYMPHNKVRPYFTHGRKSYEVTCDVDGEVQLIARARTSRVTDPHGYFPGSVPDRLVLQDRRRVVAKAFDDKIALPANRGVEVSQSRGASIEARNRRYTASTIRPICRTFVRYPFDRDLPLHISGLAGDTYDRVFRQLKRDEITSYANEHIFYAPIRWSKAIETNDHLDIILDFGGWGNNSLVTPYRVRVSWGNWSTHMKNYTKNEIEVARREAITSSKNGENKKGWLFFIGRQDDSDKGLFLVNDHHLICCLVVEMIYPRH